MIWRIAVCLILGYAFGCISTGYIVGKTQKVDIRKYGSGNVGTTNALRTLGKKAALITLLGDILKCVIFVVLMKFVFFKELPERDLLGLYTALGAVLGHTFPFYLKFKGGKGTASFVGLTLALNWKLALVVLGILILATIITDYIVIGTFSAIVTVPAYMGLFDRNLHLMAIVCIASFAIFWKHRENIGRMIRREEIGLRSTMRGDKRYDKQ